MSNLVSLDEILDSLKSESEETRQTLETAQKTADIISKLVKARVELGLSQRELAEKCGMKQPALARIETGQVIPKLNTLIRIAKGVNSELFVFTQNEYEQITVVQMIGQVFNYTNQGGYQWKLCSASLQ